MSLIADSASHSSERPSAGDASSGTVQRRGPCAFLRLGDAFDPAAQQHLHEALDWLFGTGTVHIELVGPVHAPGGAGGRWSR